MSAPQNPYDAHSVLFDQTDNYYQPDEVGQDNLAFYPSEYSPSQDYGQQYQDYPDQGYDQQQYAFTEAHYEVSNQEISFWKAFGTGGLPGEPPLLEELGVNFDHVKTKTIAVLNPFARIDTHVMDDSDLVGPLIFCLLLGASMVLSRKVQFGYIYGVAMLGWMSMYAILNLMSTDGIDLSRTASVLGYCLLPIVLLGLVSPVVDLTSAIGLVLAPIVILWSTYAASTIFVTVLAMHDQRLLVAYPIALLYTCFSLITIF